jgi:hypothetical protein
MVVVTLFFVMTVAMAQDEAKEPKSKDTKTEKSKLIEKMSGKDLYKDFCKTCHGPESPNGEYTPMHLIQEQWERFFDEKYVEMHTELPDSLRDGRPVLEVIDKKMLKKIRKFCIDGAADSEHPMTCG